MMARGGAFAVTCVCACAPYCILTKTQFAAVKAKIAEDSEKVCEEQKAVMKLDAKGFYVQLFFGSSKSSWLGFMDRVLPKSAMTISRT